MKPQWHTLMANLRINPKAVARTLLTRLDDFKPLSASEEDRIIAAIKSTNIHDSVDRMLAGLSKNAIKSLLADL